jgi:sterol desaturase/sphingolipid hydroxylase (fatty acid hydroxylase superfamily)
MFNLSRLGYYADFVTIPAFILAMMVLHLGPVFSSAAIVGGIIWSLAEYLLHRFVFHRVPFLRDEHDRHHAAPAALIGVSALATGLLLLGLWLAMRLSAGSEFGDGFMLGFAIGYVAYIAIHYQFHHGHLRPGDWFYAGFHRHALHHRGLDANFGVTSPFWDWVFGTLEKRRRSVNTYDGRDRWKATDASLSSWGWPDDRRE